MSKLNESEVLATDRMAAVICEGLGIDPADEPETITINIEQLFGVLTLAMSEFSDVLEARIRNRLLTPQGAPPISEQVLFPINNRESKRISLSDFDNAVVSQLGLTNHTQPTVAYDAEQLAKTLAIWLYNVQHEAEERTRHELTRGVLN